MYGWFDLNHVSWAGSNLDSYEVLLSRMQSIIFTFLLVHCSKKKKERKKKKTEKHMSRIVRKPDFCLGENKGADQLRGNREADQRLCFRYSDSTISLLLKSEIASF